MLEATGGFEPPNRGFADPRLRPLGYVAPIASVRGAEEETRGLTSQPISPGLVLWRSVAELPGANAISSYVVTTYVVNSVGR